ncbi:MAG: hypothetical protein ACREA0_14180, partial [bacterium]
MQHYTEAGRVHMGKERLDTMMAMVDAWWSDTSVHGIRSVSMLAGGRADVEVLNYLARSNMQAESLLAGPRLETRTGLTLQAGDRIAVRANWYSHSDLRNGQQGTVTAVDPMSGQIWFRRDHDGIEIVLPKRYVERSVDLGYAQTIHTAQGHTYQRAHVFADQSMTVEHAYTGLSRASGETHIWAADPPGPLDECSHVHGPPVTDDRYDELARRLSRSGIRLPASEVPTAVQAMADRELIDRRDELARSIRERDIARPTVNIEALDQSIAEARSALTHLGTSGARAQLTMLMEGRDAALEDLGKPGLNTNYQLRLLDEHRRVLQELDRRVAARTLHYLNNPPAELLGALGLRVKACDRQTWDAAVAIYARTQFEVGPDANLNDPAVSFTGQWREAVQGFKEVEQRAPVLT